MNKKNKIRKVILCLTLALLMASMFCINAFAAGEEPLRTHGIRHSRR